MSFTRIYPPDEQVSPPRPADELSLTPAASESLAESPDDDGKGAIRLAIQLLERRNIAFALLDVGEPGPVPASERDFNPVLDELRALL